MAGVADKDVHVFTVSSRSNEWDPLVKQERAEASAPVGEH